MTDTASNSAPTTLVIGAGFTLSRAAIRIGAERCVATSRGSHSLALLRKIFPHVEAAEISDTPLLSGIIEKHRIPLVIDGTPPLELALDELAAATEARANAFRSAGAGRMLYISTTGVYGVEDGSWVDEKTAARPKHRRAKARLAVETGYRNVFGDALTVVRAPAIYGPGRGIGHALKARTYRLIESGTRWTNRIFVDDLAAAIAQVAQSTSAPAVLALSDGTPAQACEVVDFYCKKFGLPRPPEISEEEAFAAGLETLLSNLRVNSTASWTSVGISPLVPSFKEGAPLEMT